MAGVTSPTHIFVGSDQEQLTTGDSSPEGLNEALYLFLIAGVGFFGNLLVISSIATSRTLRRMTSAFIIHCCVLDMIKSIYCVPFATSLLQPGAPSYCSVLGGSYVVIVTASGFNIVAMICCEAYSFSEHNVGNEGRGTLCCVVFGIIMVYIGSIIIHLGPTIIGGEFNYNDLIGNCIFVYGTIKSYVVHAMWIVIMTLAMVGATYYLVFFYRHVQSNSTHRLASLVRASIAISRGNIADNRTIRKVVRDSLSRARVLMTLTALFTLCWYPLFILTLADPKFKQPTKIYKLLSFIAWSNSALNPLVLILFDRNINRFRSLACCQSMCCLCRQDPDDPDMLLMPSASHSGTLSHSLANPDVYLHPESMQRRVGCRLCKEGQAHSNTHCNGGVGQGERSVTPATPVPSTSHSRPSPLHRDTSVCELHNFDV